VLGLARSEKGSGAMGRKQATFREGIGQEQRHYAQALRHVRSLRGETQQELGRLLGWSLSMISRFEAASEPPDRATLSGTVPSLQPWSCASSSPPPTKHYRR
jgi:Helix-turn-helix domain